MQKNKSLQNTSSTQTTTIQIIDENVTIFGFKREGLMMKRKEDITPNLNEPQIRQH